jgi:hypothetical protein
MPDFGGLNRTVALQLIEDVCSDLQAVVVDGGLDWIILRMSIPRSDGTVDPGFHVRVTDGQNGLTASEAVDTAPPRLPTFCPERHINRNSGLCLFCPEEAVYPTSLETAREWLGVLSRYLQTQIIAERRRCWPKGRGRAHGAAAVHEIAAEQLAQHMGDEVYRDLVAGRLIVRRKEEVVHLVRDGVTIARLADSRNDVASLRRICPLCSRNSKRGVLLRNCEAHRRDIVALIRSLTSKATAEDQFWANLGDAQCCGTLDVCPLQRGSTAGVVKN